MNIESAEEGMQVWDEFNMHWGEGTVIENIENERLIVHFPNLEENVSYSPNEVRKYLNLLNNEND